MKLMNLIGYTPVQILAFFFIGAGSSVASLFGTWAFFITIPICLAVSWQTGKIFMLHNSSEEWAKRREILDGFRKGLR